MQFALTPDNRPPRLIRFVNEQIAEVILGGVLALLDEETNVLYIDRAKYNELTKTNQNMLLRTHAKVSYAQAYGLAA